ncbi:hypothetical protein [Microbispora hainanensis]|uniref:Secreted protein n=1 Tax=Microbispora hainanensis TaxID=568844 RepID=A0A544YA74_9ACTN|nr:hypothetical protein [Microbispora hainanensis]TQS13634.1 hypothetical protein FLX08_34920 [Microbispora hainanensis]
MIARSRGRRLTTSIAMAIAATAAALLPLSPAHAAYSADQPVYLQLVSNDGNATQLALLQGTVAFDDGNTKYRYSLTLCWQHAYPAPSFRVVVNGTSTSWPTQTGSTSLPGCQQTAVYNSEVNFGSTVGNVRFDVTGGWFGSNGQYQTRTKSSYTYDNPYN